MTSLFQRHDASAVERLYAADYIQHNPAISQGRDALQALVVDLSPFTSSWPLPAQARKPIRLPFSIVSRKHM